MPLYFSGLNYPRTRMVSRIGKVTSLVANLMLRETHFSVGGLFYPVNALSKYSTYSPFLPIPTSPKVVRQPLQCPLPNFQPPAPASQ